MLNKNNKKRKLTFSIQLKNYKIKLNPLVLSISITETIDFTPTSTNANNTIKLITVTQLFSFN